MYEEIKASARAAAEEICEAAGLKKGQNIFPDQLGLILAHLDEMRLNGETAVTLPVPAGHIPPVIINDAPVLAALLLQIA